MEATALPELLNIAQHFGRLPGEKYLLLDGSRFPNVYRHLYEEDESPDFAPLFHSTPFESIQEVSPCLVRLKGGGSGILSWFLEHGAAKEKGWLFTSEAGLDELAAHFRDCLIALLPDGRHVLFRFYDPAMFQVVAKCSDVSAWKKLTGPLAKIIWHYQGVFYEAAVDTEEAAT